MGFPWEIFDDQVTAEIVNAEIITAILFYPSVHAYVKRIALCAYVPVTSVTSFVVTYVLK